VLTIEEYIARRKREDKLNEFDIEERNNNMRICVNYTFEYFNNYLNITEAEEKTALKDEKLNKYRHQLREYDKEVVDWLVGIYSEYGKKINSHIGFILKQEEFFFLYNSESEFRGLSYDCYAKLIKKFPFIKSQTEMLCLFIKEYHCITSQIEYLKPGNVDICEEVNSWIQGTWMKYQVNVAAFAYDWTDCFYDNEGIWPSTHRRKSQYDFRKYDYDYKQKSNLFNLDSLYRRMPKKAFTKGRKQEFEILMMYNWLHRLEGDENGYWQEYLEKTLPALKKV